MPLLNVWTLWWNVDRLSAGGVGYWQAPIFHPVGNAFAFSEPQPLTGTVAALLSALGAGPVTAYNLVLLLALALNGGSAYRLLRTTGVAWPAALFGGVLVLWLPFVHQELGVLQLAMVAPILWTLGALVRCARAPGPRRGLALGLALGATYLTCSYYGLMLGLLLVPAALVLLWPRLRERRLWATAAVALVAAGALAAPVVLVQKRAVDEHRFERSKKTVAKYSARPADYVEVPWKARLQPPGLAVSPTPGGRAFFPGFFKLALAGLAVVLGLRSRRRRGWTLALLLIAGSAALFSLGPNAAIGGVSLYEAWAPLVPGVGQLRSLFRFAVFPQIAVALLAAAGLAWGLRRWPGVPARLALAALGLLSVVELVPPRSPLADLPPHDLDLGWLALVGEKTSPESVLAFIPFAEGSTSADYLGTAQWMYWQMAHGRRMVNGYSGFFPATHRALKKEMRGFPSQASLERLAGLGVDYCAVHRGFVPPEAIRGVGGPWRLELVGSDRPAAIDLYELVGPDRR